MKKLLRLVRQRLQLTAALLSCGFGALLAGCRAQPQADTAPSSPAPLTKIADSRQRGQDATATTAPTITAPTITAPTRAAPTARASVATTPAAPATIKQQPAISAGHAPPLTPVLPRLIHHFRTTQPIVALTFDACQTHKPARYDAKIIGILRATHTPATLLLGGRWMATHPAITRDLGRDNLFELGNHSYWHPHMTRLSVAQMRAELQQTQDIMYRLTGKQGTLFRPPYGEYNPTLVKIAAALGLHSLVWSVETGDPDPHESAKSIIHTVATQARPGSVVIMHVNGRGWHSAEALPTVIRQLRAKGFHFVTVSQALAVAAMVPPVKSVVEHG